MTSSAAGGLLDGGAVKDSGDTCEAGMAKVCAASSTPGRGMNIRANNRAETIVSEKIVRVFQRTEGNTDLRCF